MRTIWPSEWFVRGTDTPWEAVGGGVERQLLAFDHALMMVRVRFQKGAVGALHHHPHRQATYVAAGSFQVEIGGEKRLLSEGDAFFTVPDVPHGVVALEDGILVDVFTPARDDFVRREAGA